MTFDILAFPHGSQFKKLKSEKLKRRWDMQCPRNCYPSIGSQMDFAGQPTQHSYIRCYRRRRLTVRPPSHLHWDLGLRQCNQASGIEQSCLVILA